MFDNLLETRRKKTRSAGGMIGSFILHSLAIGGALLATAGGTVAQLIEDTRRLVVPVITVYEVFKKVRRERGDDEALQAVAAMLHGRIVEVDVTLALEAGQLDLPLADSLVYAAALRAGATLWTQDADFDGVAGDPGGKQLQRRGKLVVDDRGDRNHRGEQD